MWSVDPAKSADVWIKTSASQRKWHRSEADYCDDTFDPLRLTFEVLTWTKKLTSSRLYFDHLPILLHRGVPAQVFKEATLKKLASEEKEVTRVCNDSQDCARWIQSKKTSSFIGEGLRDSPRKSQDLAIALISVSVSTLITAALPTKDVIIEADRSVERL